MIDPRAIVDSGARIAEGVQIGPFSIIGAGVEIETGTVIGPHVVIKGPTRIGRDNRIYQFASIGDDPQDKKYAGEPTRLEIGDGNTIREYVTINRGTVQDAGVTRVGHDNWIMAYVHIAHDCVVGDHTIFANNASLAGHVHVGDWAILGGYTLVHQFCRIGAHSFCGFATGVQRDVPPYVTVAGYRAEPYGINSEGLRRRGFEAETIAVIKRAYKLLYMSDLKLAEAVERMRELVATHPPVALLADFVADSPRGIVR